MNDDSTRERILETARTHLTQQNGVGDVTVARVAAAAHVSRATLYRYFPDKATLIRAASAPGGPAPTAATPRARILEAALEVFSERGMHAATLGEIANRAGLSLSGLHWHYKNKDQLVADIARHIPLMPALETAVAQAEAEGADLETQLMRIATAGLEFVERRRGLLRFLIFEAGMYPDVARLALTHTIGRGLPLLARLFEQHARAGKLRPGSARVRAQAFMGMFISLALLRPAFAPLLAPDDRETAREYIKILLRGILAEAPSDPQKG
jgi:AcrR family transcriptional regulator